MANFWQFSEIPCIEESSFNKVLERFYDFGISGLVRENIQNSLDGKLPGSLEPVKVIIRTGILSKDRIPGLEEVKEHIDALKGRNSYTKETIAHMKNKMQEEEVHFISFEDENTKGLRGAQHGQTNDTDNTWSIYAYNKGVHTEEEDESVEKSRGGSHGIGKIASNAASELYMMYFANCDAEGNQHLGGTVQLIEHQYQGHYYRSTGYFTKVQQFQDGSSKFYPFENHYDDIFSKKTRGLKIIIPFLREQFNDEKEILKGVCNSFFMSILQEKLEVVINGIIINNKTISKYIKSEEYYIQNLEEIKDFTPLYFDTYLQQKPVKLEISDKKTSYAFKLYFNYDEKIPKGRTAIIRTIGMKIEDKKIKGNVNKPYNAVLVPESIKEDAFLKSLENESHTELTFEHIKDQVLQKNAKTFINNLSKEMAKVIEKAIKESHPTDGIMNTSDVLYEVRNQFKRDLSKSTASVKVEHGKPEKTIAKVKVNIPGERKRKNKKGTGANPTGLRKVKAGNQNKSDQSEEVEKTLFSVQTDIVERIVIGNKEYLKFNFKGNKEVERANSCDLLVTVVDGMGNEYKNEFNMLHNYEEVVDKTSGNKLKIEASRIKDIKINKGTAFIELSLKPHVNKALKFIYYVEV